MTLKCRECKLCNGVVCAGEIPGLGGKDSGRSFIRNVQKWQDIKICMDVNYTDGPIDTHCQILDMDLSSPIFIAPIAGIRNNYGADIDDQEYVKMTLDGASQTGIRAFTGDGIHMDTMFVDPIKAIDYRGGKGIATMKPWVKEGIDARFSAIENLSFEALAMDVDAAGLPLLRASDIAVETKDVEALKYITSKCHKPFIVKGVMTVHSAKAALEAGASAIIVSNHGGRVLDDCLSTAEVLKEIIDAVHGEMTILVDGGIRSGMDVFKALALGADGVLVGRPFALATVKNGTDGLVDIIHKYEDQLRQTMLMTGCHTLGDITFDKIKM